MKRAHLGPFLAASLLVASSCITRRTGLCDRDTDCGPGQTCGQGTCVAQGSGGPDMGGIDMDVCPDRSRMAFIAGVRFLMGNDLGTDPQRERDEEPIHLEDVKPFYLDITEVTVGAYKSAALPDTGFPCTWKEGNLNLPVNCVTKIQAETFCKSICKRLPTEAEWEVAARGGTSQQVGRKYPWASGSSPMDILGLCWGRPAVGPCEVDKGTQDRTPEGVLGLAGNVAEWTQTINCGGGYVTTDMACMTFFAVRGGDYEQNDSKTMRAARRLSVQGVTKVPSIGFRCAADPPP